jgi:hypothetical protein
MDRRSRSLAAGAAAREQRPHWRHDVGLAERSKAKNGSERRRAASLMKPESRCNFLSFRQSFQHRSKQNYEKKYAENKTQNK